MTGRLAAGQLPLRIVMFLGPLVALASTSFVGSPPAWWLVVVVGVASAAFAVAPDGLFGTVAFVLVLAWWGVSLRDGLHPEAILASLALVASHAAGVVASYGPRRTPVDRALTLLWTRRALTVGVSAPVVWSVAVLVRDQPEPPGIWVAGLFAAIVAALAASAAIAVRLGGP